MLKRVISEKYQTSRKEKKTIQEETSPTVTTATPLEATWGCLLSSSSMIELFRKKHVLGNKESDGDVCEFIFVIIHFFVMCYQQRIKNTYTRRL